MNNHFDAVVDTVQKAPQNQRADTAISGICQQMQSSDNPTTKQLGAELAQAKPRLVQALQQGG